MAKKKKDTGSTAAGDATTTSNTSNVPASSSSYSKKGTLPARVQALQTKATTLPQPLSNVTKRALYYEAEMLWQSIKDELPAEHPDHASLLAAIDQFETDLLRISPAQLATTSFQRILQRLDMLLRIVTCSLYLCLLGVITFLPMITLVPILDRLLKFLGWPRRFLIYELAKKASARGFLYLAGVFYTEEGKQPDGYETPLVLLFQHGSNLDGFLILDSFPQFFKSIGKDDIFLMPYVGWMAYVYGILPIDRKHRHEAIKQLGRATRVCASGVAVALSPEGTRSKTGQLMRFKKGPFYVQAETSAIVTPLVILGNYELWPPNYLFTCPGQVVMRYLPPIDPSSLPPSIGQNKDELSRYVRKQMFEAIDEIMSGSEEGGKEGRKKRKYAPGGELTWWLRGVNWACMCLFWLMVEAAWVVVTGMSDAYGFSRGALAGGFVAYTVSVTAGLYILYCKAPAS
jgi:1-acyl-sn-glycerol-3-phosphate acyltransferase